MQEQIQTAHSRRFAKKRPSVFHLISDLALVNEAVKFLQDCGGRASAVEVADAILYTNALDAQTAAMFISELISDDARFRFVEEKKSGAFVELLDEKYQSHSLREVEFVVVDVETTGARVPPCRVMELGAYRIRQNQIVAEFHTLVNPQMPIPTFISELTGISDEMVAGAPPFEEIAADWLNFVGASILVAHNAAFDVRFLNHEVGRAFPNKRMANAHLCTVKLSRQLLPELPNHRLHTLADYFSIPILNRHRARDDAHATARAFLHLLNLLEESGAPMLKDLSAFHSPIRF